MLGELASLVASLGWGDVLDIGIVSAMVYGVILWLRRSHASLIALGLALLSVVYLCARLLDLALTTLAFQSLLAVSAVVLAVIFQEELRQTFEELAARVLGRRAQVRPRLDTRDILVEWLFKLAGQHRGALVVLPGQQPLDRLLHGGIPLDGQLSGPLLQSLFDPCSAGHDGAAIVENRRVVRFGVHLPLARNPLQSAGTRHSAALGLSERSDALCLIVSEERGEVSLAQDGVLARVESAEQLGRRIDRFYRDRVPLRQHRPALVRWLLDDTLAKATACAIAGLLWTLYVPGSRPAEVSLPFPVEVAGLPDSLEIDEVVPAQVTATVRGTRRDLLFLDDRSMRVRVDASLADAGRRTFELSESDVTLPSGLVVTGLHPDRIKISLR